MTDRTFRDTDRERARESTRESTRLRLRALAWFLLALLYAVFAQQFSSRTAALLLPGSYDSLASRLFYVVFLLVGFAAMGALGQSQKDPIPQMGLARRPGYGREWLLGARFGWGGVVACVLPIALTGGMLVTVSRGGAAWGALLLDVLILLLASLADELVFRGYPFQRLIEVTGPGLAALLMALLFALGHAGGGGEESVSGSLNTVLLGLLLAMAYLRTRALWVCWGLHFAWVASMALLFGLPADGLMNFAPVVSTYTTESAWLTGGGYGPQGSALATVVLLVLMVLLARSTRELRHRWAQPVIVGAGIPVDIDAISRRQHERGMGPGEPAAGGLVQIAPPTPPPDRP